MMFQGMIAAYTFPRSMRVFIVGNALFLISVRLVFSRYPISQIWYKVRSWSAIIPAISPARVVGHKIVRMQSEPGVAHQML